MRNPLATLTDQELIHSLKILVRDERRRTIDILKHLNEMDRRRLAERRGFPSLFDYCVRDLRYVHGAAARLIHAARAASKFEMLYKTMERGLLSVTTVSILAPHLKWQNHRRLIREAAGKTAREVEALVATLVPVAAAPAERIRFLSVAAVGAAAAPSGSQVEDLFASPVELPSPPIKTTLPATTPEPLSTLAAAPASPAAPAPAVRRVHFSFTADEALLRDVERAKELSRHKWPGGKLEDVFAGAIKVLLDKIDPDRRNRRKERVRRLAAGARSRHISQAVKDEVWRRDEGRCAFESADGRVCGARGNLEFDHVRPWALGGSTGDAANVRLLCRAHNSLEARRVLGDAVIDAAAARRRGALRRGVKI